MPMSHDEYFVELGEDDMSLTVYKAGDFQLYFSDENGNHELYYVQSYDVDFKRSFDIMPAKTELQFDETNLGFKPVSYRFAPVDRWSENPVYVDLENGVLTAKVIGVGEGYLYVTGEYGQRQKIYIFGHKNA